MALCTDNTSPTDLQRSTRARAKAIECERRSYVRDVRWWAGIVDVYSSHVSERSEHFGKLILSDRMEFHNVGKLGFCVVVGTVKSISRSNIFIIYRRGFVCE